MATDLTILETADQLNVSEGFVLAEISAGRLGCRVVDGERLVPADELVAYRDALRARQERSLQGLADSTQELGSGEPIEPHMTLGFFDRAAEAEQVARIVERQHLPMHGRVEELALLRRTADGLETLRSVRL